jgi:hypothetical protein
MAPALRGKEQGAGTTSNAIICHLRGKDQR